MIFGETETDVASIEHFIRKVTRVMRTDIQAMAGIVRLLFERDLLSVLRTRNRQSFLDPEIMTKIAC